MFTPLQQLGDLEHDGKGALTGNTASLLDERIERGPLLFRNAVPRCRGYSCHDILLFGVAMPLAKGEWQIRSKTLCQTEVRIDRPKSDWQTLPP
jgi:hypothetical protein